MAFWNGHTSVGGEEAVLKSIPLPVAVRVLDPSRTGFINGNELSVLLQALCQTQVSPDSNPYLFL